MTERAPRYQAGQAVAERRTATLLLLLRGAGLPPPQLEYRFHPKRRWRFDLAWPEYHLAVELDGGEWLARGGRHNTDADREKLNHAAVLGWRVLRFSGQMIERDPWGCRDLVAAAILHFSLPNAGGET